MDKNLARAPLAPLFVPGQLPTALLDSAGEHLPGNATWHPICAINNTSCLPF